MLMPGPRMTEILSRLASRPSASPTSVNRSEFQDDPMPDAVGKQVAGSLPDRPTWSASFS